DGRSGRVDALSDAATVAVLVIVVIPLNKERRVAGGYDAPSVLVEGRTPDVFGPLGEQVRREAGRDGVVVLVREAEVVRVSVGTEGDRPRVIVVRQVQAPRVEDGS